MHILVIGGSGFVGTVLTRSFAAAGHKITVLSRGQRNMPDGVETIIGDRKDHAAFKTLVADHSFDAVFDCLCYNAEDAQSDVEAFAGRIQQLFFLSTDFVYGGDDDVVIRTEDYPRQAYNSYGQNKAAAEDVFAHAWQEQQFPSTILRAPHILGAGRPLGTGSLKNRDATLLDAIRKGVPIVVLDDGALLIQPATHHDIANATLAALGKQQTLGQAYNMMGNDVVTSRRYYEIAGQIIGCEPKFLSVPTSVYLQAAPTRRPFAQHRIYDISKLKRDADYDPTWTVRAGIEDTIKALEATDGANQPYEPTERDAALQHALETHSGDLLKILG